MEHDFPMVHMVLVKQMRDDKLVDIDTFCFRIGLVIIVLANIYLNVYRQTNFIR